jgi:excisionase family DNA binding protein
MPSDPAAVEQQLLTAPQAAKVLAISERALWQLGKDGELPVVRLGRAVRYDRRDLLDFIEKRKDVSGV